jgi:hypothetical protein
VGRLARPRAAPCPAGLSLSPSRASVCPSPASRLHPRAPMPALAGPHGAREGRSSRPDWPGWAGFRSAGTWRVITSSDSGIAGGFPGNSNGWHSTSHGPATLLYPPARERRSVASPLGRVQKRRRWSRGHGRGGAGVTGPPGGWRSGGSVRVARCGVWDNSQLCASVAALRGRYADGPASQSQHPRAGPDGRTDPLRHRRLSTDSPSRPQLTRAPPGRRTIRVLDP